VGVFESSFSDPSIITEVKPRPMASFTVSSEFPWSRWTTIGMSGFSIAAASISFFK